MFYSLLYSKYVEHVNWALRSSTEDTIFLQGIISGLYNLETFGLLEKS